MRPGIARVRRVGAAVQRNRSETGVSAVGVPVEVPGETPSTVSIAMPTLRYDPTELRSWLRELRITVSDVRDALAREVAAMQLAATPAPAAAQQPPMDG